MDGKYTIKAREGEVLEFRYIGYNSVEQKVKDKSVINIAMAESNVNLDDVVVIGYGSQKIKYDCWAGCWCDCYSAFWRTGK